MSSDEDYARNASQVDSSHDEESVNGGKNPNDRDIRPDADQGNDMKSGVGDNDSGRKDSGKDGNGGKSDTPRSKTPLIITAIIVVVLAMVGFFIWFAHRN